MNLYSRCRRAGIKIKATITISPPPPGSKPMIMKSRSVGWSTLVIGSYTIWRC